MRGSPPLHLALFLLGFALIALPLVRLTSATPSASLSMTAVKQEQAEASVLIRLRFAHKPVQVKLAYHDTVLHEGDTETLQELIHSMSIPEEGVELSLTVQWPEGTPETAVTLELEPDSLDTQAQTRWSSGLTLDEVIPFVWKK